MSQRHSQPVDIEPTRPPSQFDLLLAAIPLALMAGAVGGLVVSGPQFVGIILGAAVAACLVGYGVYAIAANESAS